MLSAQSKFLELVVELRCWLAGGPAASLGASLALTLFFAREDRAPVAS